MGKANEMRSAPALNQNSKTLYAAQGTKQLKQSRLGTKWRTYRVKRVHPEEENGEFEKRPSSGNGRHGVEQWNKRPASAPREDNGLTFVPHCLSAFYPLFLCVLFYFLFLIFRPFINIYFLFLILRPFINISK